MKHVSIEKNCNKITNGMTPQLKFNKNVLFYHGSCHEVFLIFLQAFFPSLLSTARPLQTLSINAKILANDNVYNDK